MLNAFLPRYIFILVAMGGLLVNMPVQASSVSGVSPGYRVLKQDRIYESVSAPSGRSVYTRVENDGRLTLWEDEQKIAENDALVFGPAMSDDGLSLAYSSGEYSQQYSRMVIDDVDYGVDKALDWQVVYDAAGRPAWLRADFTKRRPKARRVSLCRRPRLNDDAVPVQGTIDCLSLDFLASRLIRWGDDLAVIGYDEAAQEYRMDEVRLTHDGFEVTPLLMQDTPLVVREGEVFTMHMTGNLARPLWSYLAAGNLNRQESFTYGSNNLGRLSWHSANRISLMSNLYEASNDPVLRDHLDETVERILKRASPKGRYLGKKYSKDRERRLSWMVLDGAIYDALWDAYPYVRKSLQDQIEAQTRTALTDMERFWDGEGYAWPRAQKWRKAVGPLPFNQQNMMGTVMIKMMIATDTDDYRERVQTLFNQIEDELLDLDGATVWRYWPLSHFEQGFGKSKSIDKLEDVGHASINAEFQLAAAKFLGRESTVIPEDIVTHISVDGGAKFHRSLEGDHRGYAASRYWVPTRLWARTDEAAPLFESWIDLPRAPFDQAHISAAYAERLPDFHNLYGTLTVKRLVKKSDGSIGRRLIYYGDFEGHSAQVSADQRSENLVASEGFWYLIELMDGMQAN